MNAEMIKAARYALGELAGFFELFDEVDPAKEDAMAMLNDFINTVESEMS